MFSDAAKTAGYEDTLAVKDIILLVEEAMARSAAEMAV